MSAEVLREAASLMRERAEAATKDAPTPWDASVADGDGSREIRDGEGICIAYSETGHNASLDGTVAEHIASWHPAVALAVADWLERCARILAEGWSCYGPEVEHAIAVARAYLGRDS